MSLSNSRQSGSFAASLKLQVAARARSAPDGGGTDLLVK